MSDLTHIDNSGRGRMVDVTEKGETERIAIARSTIQMLPSTLELIKTGGAKKGDVLGVAQVAAVMGSKQTPNLIPMCHPLLLTNVEVDFEIDDENSSIHCFVTAKLTGKTGVEMEALTAASIAALTIYDMCKAVDKGMIIKNVCLLEKMGGKSGHYKREGDI